MAETKTKIKIPPRTSLLRCPSWSKGNDLKCARDPHSDEPHMARRVDTSDLGPGELVVWTDAEESVCPPEDDAVAELFPIARAS